MRKSLLQLLRAPKTLEPLSLHPFDSRIGPNGDETVINGILLTDHSKQAYPIVDGVPVMLDSSFTSEFLDRHAKKIAHARIPLNLDQSLCRNSRWSFSAEWAKHFSGDLTKTWGWSVEQRVKQFLMEIGIEEAGWCEGKLILDAGCGNGQLSEGLSALGAIVVGLDYSSSVIHAERVRKSSGVDFVQGDLRIPPFDTSTFDLVISNGVLHHTPDTSQTFNAVAKLVKPGGRFYLWLYRKPEKFFRRYIFYTALDLARVFVSRTPGASQGVIVKTYALALMTLHKFLGRRQDLSWPERVVVAYDTLTPLWRHYHTPIEVGYWFFKNGYSAATLSHWDNPYGFGMVAAKIPQVDTPGVNFGRSTVTRRYWQ